MDKRSIEINLDVAEDLMIDFKEQVENVISYDPIENEASIDKVEDYQVQLINQLKLILDGVIDYSNDHPTNFIGASDLTEEEKAVVSGFLDDVGRTIADPVTNMFYDHGEESKIDIAHELYDFLRNKFFSRFKDLRLHSRGNDAALEFKWRGKAYKVVITED